MRQSRMNFLLLTAFVSAVSASPLFRNLVLHEERNGVPNGFVKVSDAAANQMMNFSIALENSDMAGLKEKLYSVSTPGSELYGQHLSKEEVVDSHLCTVDYRTKSARIGRGVCQTKPGLSLAG